MMPPKTQAAIRLERRLAAERAHQLRTAVRELPRYRSLAEAQRAAAHPPIPQTDHPQDQEVPHAHQ